MKYLHSDILVIGEGFGGIYTISNLINKGIHTHKKITLIGKKNYFIFTPLLHEVATGGLNANEISIPIKTLFGNKIDFINTTVTKIDFDNKSVTINDDHSIKYKYLVIATGAKSKTNLIQGADINAYFLKTLNDAIKIKNKILEIFENYTINKNPIHINVIGGGPTGVELICEIAELVNNSLANLYGVEKTDITLNLITNDEMLLKAYSKKIQIQSAKYLANRLNIKLYLNQSCKNIQKDQIELSGFTLKSDLTIATIGVEPELPTTKQEIEKDPTQRIKTNQYLQLQNHNEVYVIGDIASGNTMDAQVAIKQSKNVADNIIKNLEGKSHLSKFKYISMGKFLSLGRNNAAGEIFGIKITGKLVWFIWRTIYFVKIPSAKKRIYIGVTWFLGLFYKRDTAIFSD